MDVVIAENGSVETRDVFEVSMVVGDVAELTTVAEGREFPIDDPLMVPAAQLCAVAGCTLDDLPGMLFVSSESGFRVYEC